MTRRTIISNTLRNPVSYIDFLKLKSYIRETYSKSESNEGNQIEFEESIQFPDYKGTKVNILA